MKNRVKRGWLFLGMGALAVLLVVVALVVSAGAGPNEIAAGPKNIISTTAARAFRLRQK